MNEREGLHINLFKEKAKEFRDHLLVKENQRIIFSGRFGIGKSTFLEEFFKPDNQKIYFKVHGKHFNAIRLYPVNYAIASNEDIFRYIKHDIILELLKSEDSFKEEVVSYWKTAPDFLKKNAHKVLAGLIRMIPKVGGDVVESFERLDKLKEEFFNYHDEENKKLNETQNLFEYIDDIQNNDSGLYENDFITSIIENVLSNKIKEVDDDENVLVIDDLDRIDPDHIFRILNIFSSHFDRQNPKLNKHKFGFDKVILVCDIENIRDIFSAKHGSNADFNGYIDKFYSHRVFDFNFNDELYKLVYNLIHNSEWATTEDGRGYTNALDYYRGQFDKRSTFLYDILSILIHNNELQLRNIIKYEKKYPFKFNQIIYIKGHTIDLEENHFVFCILMLVQIKGGYDNLIKSLKKCHSDVKLRGEIPKYIIQLINIYEIDKLRNSNESMYNTELNSMVWRVNANDNTISLIKEKSTLLDPELTQKNIINCLIKAIEAIQAGRIAF